MTVQLLAYQEGFYLMEFGLVLLENELFRLLFVYLKTLAFT